MIVTSQVPSPSLRCSLCYEPHLKSIQPAPGPDELRASFECTDCGEQQVLEGSAAVTLWIRLMAQSPESPFPEWLRNHLTRILQRRIPDALYAHLVDEVRRARP